MIGQTRIQPPYESLMNNVTVHPLGPECLGKDILPLDTAIGSAVWTANLLIFVPLILSESLLVAKFYWYNGTAANGNTDVGIYNETGTVKLASTGSTVNSGTSVIQSVDVTDFYLPANIRLWMALGCDDGTHTFVRGDAVADILNLTGVKQQASGWSSGLPSTISLDAPSVAKLPVFGFTGKAVI